MRVGVVGLQQGLYLATWCRRLGMEVVVGCDRDPARRDAARTLLPGTALVDEWRALLDERLDAVVSANDFDDHALPAVTFLDAGVHVLSETAACVDEQQVRALLAAERRSSAAYSFAENFVFHPHVRLVRSIVEQGEVGRVTLVEADYLHGMAPDAVAALIGDPAHWRGRIAPTAYCTHTLSPVLALTGARPVEVTAFPVDSADPRPAVVPVVRRERRRARLRRVLGSPGAIGFALVVFVPILALVGTWAVVPLFRSESDATVTPPSETAPLREHAPIDLSRPFANTPAANWPEGEAGIVPPPPAPLGRYSAEQVGKAMSAVRQLIVTARLDRHVLHTHDAEPVLALLAPHQAEEARTVLQRGGSESWWIHVEIADGFRLLPATPRVTGSMTPVLDPEGELVIRTNYLVAYAFDVDYPEALSSPLEIVAVDRWEADYVWVDDPQYDAGSQGIYYGDVRGSRYPVDCALADRGLLAPQYSNPPAPFTEPEPQRPGDYFDPNAPLMTESNC